MKLFDLTHNIVPEMPVFPGTEPPVIDVSCTVEADGFLEKKITMYSHTGTHIDAPAHLIRGGNTLDDFPVEKFAGQAIVYHHSNNVERITRQHLEHLEKGLKDSDFLLLATGWDAYWGTAKFYGTFPTLTEEAAHWLTTLNLKGVGLDVISADPIAARDLPIHKILLGKDMVIVENLKGVKALPVQTCHFSCFPLYFRDADGSPIRAVAMIVEEKI